MHQPPRLVAAPAACQVCRCREPITVRRRPGNAEAAVLSAFVARHIGTVAGRSGSDAGRRWFALISTVFSPRWFPPTSCSAPPRQPWACQLVWGGPGPGRAAPDRCHQPKCGRQPDRAWGITAPPTPAVIQRQVLENPLVVHRLHPVPGGDRPGAVGGPAQLSDPDQRAHRPADRQRLFAR